MSKFAILAGVLLGTALSRWRLRPDHALDVVSRRLQNALGLPKDALKRQLTAAET